MALYNSIIPCTAMFTLPLGAWFVLQGWSTLPDLVLVLCMSFGVGAPLLRSLSFLSTMPQVNFKIEALEQLMSAPPLQQTDRPFAGKNHSISFEDVRFGYQEEEVLHGVSLSAREGSLVALVGESGSGKSTLLHMLSGMDRASMGEIYFKGTNFTKYSEKQLAQFRRINCGYVFQQIYLINSMNLMDNVLVSGLLVGKNKKADSTKGKRTVYGSGTYRERVGKIPFTDFRWTNGKGRDCQGTDK